MPFVEIKSKDGPIPRINTFLYNYWVPIPTNYYSFKDKLTILRIL